MIDRDHKLPVTRQAKLLDISRGTVYYLPQPVSCADLALMRKIDELQTNGTTSHNSVMYVPRTAHINGAMSISGVILACSSWKHNHESFRKP